MSKRIYFASVKNWIIKHWKLISGTAVATGTSIGYVFFYLASIGAITVSSYSGDMVCAGTLEEPCYAYINFTANEDIFLYPTGYDPWGRDTTFEFDPNLREWKLHRSWGSGWRDIPLNQSCTGTWCGAKDNSGEQKFAWTMRKDRDYQIRIVAYKNDPTDTIKWSAFDGKVDPYWLGVEKEDNKSAQPIITFSDDCKIRCVNEKCSTSIGQTTYVRKDGKCVLKEQAKSLKNTNIKLQIKTDGIHKVECKDYNWTHIDCVFSLYSDVERESLEKKDLINEDINLKNLQTTNYLEKEIPIKTGLRQIKTENFKSIHENKSNIVAWNKNNMTIHFGENSTEVTLQDADSENLEDSYIFDHFPDKNYGGETYFRTGEPNLYDGFYHSLITFNISEITGEDILIKINDATLYLYLGDIYGPTSNTDIQTKELDNVTWSEDTITYNNYPSSDVGSELSTFSTSGLSIGDWLDFDVKSFVNENINENEISFFITQTNFPVQSVWYYSSKENANTNQRPKLIINFSYVPLNITQITPTTNITVANQSSFTWTTQVCCDRGDGDSCGDVNLTLDPESQDFTSFETGWDNWTAGYIGDSGCTPQRDSGGTGSSGTGPSSGAESTSWYVYTEMSSSACGNGFSGIITHDNNIDWDSTTEESITFYYHRYGSNVDEQALEENSTGSWVEIWDTTEASSNTWRSHTQNLTHLGGTGSLRFRIDGNGDWSNDLAFDHVRINYTLGVGADDKGGDIPQGSGSPFYVDESNPYTISSLADGDCENVSWTVHANGPENTTYEFFVYSNISSTQTDTLLVNITAFSGNPSTNFSIWTGSTWTDVGGSERIQFRCTPTQTNCEPVNQNAGGSQSIYKVCNNGSVSGDNVYMHLNETFSNIDMKCDDDYTSSGATVLTTSNQTIHGTLASDACTDISCWTDYSNPTSGGIFEVFAYVD